MGSSVFVMKGKPLPGLNRRAHGRGEIQYEIVICNGKVNLIETCIIVLDNADFSQGC